MPQKQRVFSCDRLSFNHRRGGDGSQNLRGAGKVTFKDYDDAGREVTVIENHVASFSSSSRGDCPASDDQNRTTQHTYP